MEAPSTVDTTPDVMAVLRAVPGLTERLAAGLHVADVGGGSGSTLTMAAAFPRSRFLGVEPDPVSLERARFLTAARRLRNVFWLGLGVRHLAPRPTYDLICAFEGLHDAADPPAALRAVRAALGDDGLTLLGGLEREPDVRALATVAGFSRVDALRGDRPDARVVALRR